MVTTTTWRDLESWSIEELENMQKMIEVELRERDNESK